MVVGVEADVFEIVVLAAGADAFLGVPGASVAASVRSNLTTILGRMAAYKNGVVTWQEMMKANEKFVADFKGLKV